MIILILLELFMLKIYFFFIILLRRYKHQQLLCFSFYYIKRGWSQSGYIALNYTGSSSWRGYYFNNKHLILLKNILKIFIRKHIPQNLGTLTKLQQVKYFSWQVIEFYC